MADENNQNPDQPQAVTLDQLKAMFAEFQDGVSQMVTGAVTKSHKALEGKIGDAVKTQLTSVLDEVIPADEPAGTGNEGQPPAQASDTTPEPTSDDPAVRFQQMMQQQLAQQQAQIDAQMAQQQKEYEQRITAMQKAVDDERLNTAKSQARQKALDPIRDRVHNPELTWAYLESKGVTYDADKGGYGIVGQDEFQNPTFTPISQVVSGLDKEAAYLFTARPGSGTGAQPAGSNGNGIGTPNNSAYSAESKVDANSRFNVLKESTDPLKAITDGLAAAQQNGAN
ncbi:MAG: hypothetical protein AAF773_00850 [Cyanobacteria bacterium P01_D01_bin.115]